MPDKKRLDFFAPGFDTKIQTLNFLNVNCDDGQWHKIQFSVYVDRVVLYLDCKQHETVPIGVRSQIDVNGDISVAKYEDDLTTVPVMIMVIMN